MKKFNLFAIGVVAMLMAATGVYAEDNNNITEVSELKACLSQTTDATCHVAKSLTGEKALDEAVTVNKKINLTLAKDVVVETKAAITVAKDASLTIDGGTISRTDTAIGQVIIVKEGTLNVDNTTLKSTISSTATETSKSVVAVMGGNVTMGVNSVIDGYAGLIVYPTNYPSAGSNAGTVTINLNGNITAKQYAVQVNGRVTEGTVKVNVNAGTYKSTESAALYAAGIADWEIGKDVKVSGLEAILAKAGKVTVNGGTFTATGNTGSGSDKNLRAGSAAGATVAVVATTGYNTGSEDGIVLNIVDGTFTSDKGNVLYLDDTAATGTVIPNVKGGSFVAKTSSQEALKVVALDEANEIFVEGGSFKGKESTSGLDDKYLAADLSSGEDAKGNVIVGTPHTIKVNVILDNGVKVSYTIPAESDDKLSRVNGEKIDLIELLSINKNVSGDSSKRYAVRYTLSNGTTGLDEFTMIDDDVTVDAVIVMVSSKTKPSETIPTTPTPGTDNEGENQGSENQGGNQGSENQGGTTDEDLDNPNTLDNVTSVAAMGGISLAIAAAGIATLKKREN